MQTTAKLTHVQQRQKAATSLKQKICLMLNWSEVAYAQFQYETGLEYLMLYTLDDQLAIAQLECSKIFWNWWKNSWANRDETFLHNLTVFKCYDKEKMYRKLHDALALAEEMTPDAIVLGESYKVMIGEVIKKEVSNG